LNRNEIVVTSCLTRCGECTGQYSDTMDLVKLKCQCICHNKDRYTVKSEQVEKGVEPRQPVQLVSRKSSHKEFEIYDY
jgi:hypothetical protein